MGSNINILKSKAENDYQFPTYADATADTSFYQIGDIVVVEQTTGGIFGFGSKQAGSYRWTGTSLEYFSQSLKDEIKENEDSTHPESDWQPNQTRYPAPNRNSNIFIDDEKTRNGFKMTQAGKFVLPVKLPTQAYNS